MKTDCFAYRRHSETGKAACMALKRISCEKCSFYKTAQKETEELTRYNNTSCVEDAIAKYASVKKPGREA